MDKGSGLKLIVLLVMILLILTNLTPADLMKIDFPIGLSIPSNNWSDESRTTNKYWFTSEIISQHNRLVMFEQRISQMLALDTKSIANSFNTITESIDSDIEMFAIQFYGTIYYDPITDLADKSFGGTASAPLHNFSSLIGKTDISVSDIWH